jgi:hypothetical protein
VREDHPRLEIIILADALQSSGALIRDLKLMDMDFILNLKEGSHEKLFANMARWEKLKQVEAFVKEEEIGEKIKKKVIHEFQYTDKVLLNNAGVNLEVNFVEYWESTQWVSPKWELKEQKRHFSWYTNLELTEKTLIDIMREGRSRWKIENETFSTLKNQGYEFEHNFGFGYKNLSVNFSCLTMLAFMFDQLQELGCKLYQKALKTHSSRRSYLFEYIKSLYLTSEIIFTDWVQFMEAVSRSGKWKMTLTLDAS